MKDLTLNAVKELKGKTIKMYYSGYAGQDGEALITVGEVVSRYDLAKRDTNIEGFENRAEYWESYMSENELHQKKHTLILLDANGKKTFAFAERDLFLSYNKWARENGEEERTDIHFCGSDSDRLVTYELIDVECPLFQLSQKEGWEYLNGKVSAPHKLDEKIISKYPKFTFKKVRERISFDTELLYTSVSLND